MSSQKIRTNRALLQAMVIAIGMPIAYAQGDDTQPPYGEPADEQESLVAAEDPLMEESPVDEQSVDEAGAADDPPLAVIPVEPLTEEAPAPKAADAGTQLDDIVVTAQKREQHISDVPISVTAFSGDALEKMGVQNLRDLAAFTPSFSVVEAGPGVQHLQMRGISSPFGQATVGYQLDNVSLSSFSLTQPDAATFDLASVEILRGPQGTLYGEGSMGGTVKLLTQKPRIGEWEFVAKGGGFITDGGDPGVEANTAINVPLGDTLAARVVAGVSDLGGYIDQVDLGEDNYNAAKKKNGRVRVQWEPGETWTIGAMALVQSIDAGSSNAADENYERHDSVDIGIDDNGRIYSADLNWSPGWVDLFWTASLFERDNEVIFDSRDIVISQLPVTGIPALDDLLRNFASELIKGSPGGYVVSSDSKMTELRLSSMVGGNLFWTAGVYAREYHQILDLLGEIKIAPLPPLPGFPGLPDGLTIPIIDVTTDSRSLATSVFGQLEYDWTSWLNTALGARYYSEKLDIDNSGTAAFMDASSSDKLDFSAFTPRFVVSLRAPDRFLSFIDRSLFYLSYAEGFRSGGANIQASPEIPPAYDPDTLQAYEVGAKMDLWGGLLTAELATYFNQWRDVQVVVVPPGGTGSFTAIQNQGNAEGVGVDWSLTLRPAPRFTIYHSGGYIDTEFVTDSGAKNKGDPIDFVSPFTAALGASYGFSWPSGYPGSIRVDYSYAAESRYQREGSYDYRSDPLRMLGARIGLETEMVQFHLYGRNLLDNEGALDANQPERRSRARPPSYGVEMKVTF